MKIHIVPTKWRTFYGQTMDISQLSHQHMSNIMHFFRLIWDEEIQAIKDELDNRFGGIVLPYHPCVAFVEEIRLLTKKGYTTGELDADIVVDGKWIGKIKYN